MNNTQKIRVTRDLVWVRKSITDKEIEEGIAICKGVDLLMPIKTDRIISRLNILSAYHWGFKKLKSIDNEAQDKLIEACHYYKAGPWSEKLLYNHYYST